MKVVFLTFGNERTPSSRYRVFQYLKGLQAADWETTVITPRRGEPSWRTSLRALSAVKKADLLFLQKRLFPGICLRLLSAAAKRRIVYDFDDALFALPNGQTSKPSHQRTLRRLRHTLRESRAVIAGNSFLAAYARNFNPHVQIIPTPIDLAAHPRRPVHTQENPQIIGWVGTSSNHHYLDSLSEVFCQVSENISVVLRVVSNRAFDTTAIKVENVQWEPEKEAALLQEFDVSIMPLKDDVWSRGKCAFKALQCMALGIPVVCSPVGANVEVIRNGVDGCHAANPEEWIDALGALLEDARLREQIGSAGRDTVAQRFSIEVMLPRLIECFHEFAAD